MGIYDREYIREDEHGAWNRAPYLMVTKLVIINVAVYLVDILFFHSEGRRAEPDPLIGLFALRSDLLTHPWQFYQLLTYGFLHDPVNVWHILGNMLVLWFLGREVEGIYGPKEFLQLYLSSTVLAGLAWVLCEMLLGSRSAYVVGASGAVTAVAVVFVMHFPRRMVYLYFLIPVPIWVVAVVFLVFDAYRTAVNQGAVASSAHLAGAAVGYLYYRTRWHLGRLIPRRFLLGDFSLRGRVRIHQPDDEEQGRDADLKVEVDRILEKISRQGEASLSSRERRTLEEASRRYQRRRS